VTLKYLWSPMYDRVSTYSKALWLNFGATLDCMIKGYWALAQIHKSTKPWRPWPVIPALDASS